MPKYWLQNTPGLFHRVSNFCEILIEADNIKNCLQSVKNLARLSPLTCGKEISKWTLIATDLWTRNDRLWNLTAHALSIPRHPAAAYPYVIFLGLIFFPFLLNFFKTIKLLSMTIGKSTSAIYLGSILYIINSG